MLNSCRDKKKLSVDGEALYEGGWFRMRQTDLGIIAAIVDYGFEWVSDCFNNCRTNDGGITCLITECNLLFHYRAEIGQCYPVRCSPAEILIATVTAANINNTSAYPLGVYGVDVLNYTDPKYTDLDDGIWKVLQISS